MDSSNNRDVSKVLQQNKAAFILNTKSWVDS